MSTSTPSLAPPSMEEATQLWSGAAISTWVFACQWKGTLNYWLSVPLAFCSVYLCSSAFSHNQAFEIPICFKSDPYITLQLALGRIFICCLSSVRRQPNVHVCLSFIFNKTVLNQTFLYNKYQTSCKLHCHMTFSFCPLSQKFIADRWQLALLWGPPACVSWLQLIAFWILAIMAPKLRNSHLI